MLLFDLDATLTDPRPGIVRCMKHALDKIGAAAPPDEVLTSFIGPSLRGTFATLLETSDRGLIEQVLALYREEPRNDRRIRAHQRPAVKRALHQLLALMRRAGLEPLAWYGGLDGSTLHLGSRRLVLISTRRP